MDRVHTDWAGVSFGVALGWLTAFQYFKLPPALPVLLDRFDYSSLVAGSFMSVFALAGLLLSTWIGRHYGHFGVRRVVLVSLSLFLLGSSLGAYDPALMIVSRCMEALGYAALSVVGVVVTVGSAAPRHKALAAGLWATWIPAGQIIAALVSIAALEAGFWQANWILGSVACVLFMALASRMGPERGGPFAVANSASAPATSGGVVLVTRANLAPVLLFALWSIQFVAFMTWLPEFLVNNRDMPVDRAALAYLGVAAMLIVFNLVAGFALKRGLSPTLVLTLALLVQGLLWLVLPSIESRTIGLLALLVYGSLAGIIPTCMFSLPHALGMGSAASAGAFGELMAGRNLGALAGPMLLPQIYALTESWSSVAWVFGGVTLLASGIGAATVVRGPRGGWANRPGTH